MNRTQAMVAQRARRMKRELLLERKQRETAVKPVKKAAPIRAPRRLNVRTAKPAPCRAGVYMFACGEYVKIGRAADIARRFAEILAVNPYVEFVGLLSFDPDDEGEWHIRFAEHRHQGEWFRAEPVFALLSSENSR